MSVEPAAHRNQRLVNATAETMRELILAQAPDTLLGSQPDMARMLQVGVATVQQAARILEHEGLLEVRRGPGGGYFGRRPDAGALERSVATYLRVVGSGSDEARSILSALDGELMPAAARCRDATLLQSLRALGDSIDSRLEPEQRFKLELDLRALLFRMVDWPLMELLVNVSMRYVRNAPQHHLFADDTGRATWYRLKHKIIDAILDGDPDLARFEAQRFAAALQAEQESHQHALDGYSI